MQVLEAQDEGPPAGERLEDAPDRAEGLLAGSGDLGAPRQAADHLQHVLALLSLERIRGGLLAAELAQDLGERPVGDPDSVGEAVPDRRRRPLPEA